METNEPKRKPGRPPGTPRTGGRKKGTPNKVTAKTRKVLATALESVISDLAADLAKMTPTDRVNAVAKLLGFVMPKMQAVTMEVEADVKNQDAVQTLTPQQAKEFIRKLETDY